eukprot:m.297353 g.297353  ORF g.297353 m.297353 type:complete len:128 (-) comp55166_c0_seq5:5-388(-)
MTDLLPDRREAALDPLLDHWEEVAQLNSLPKKDPLGFIQEEEYLDDAAQGPSTPILAALEHLQEPDTKPKAAESNPAESNAAEPKATKPEKRRASESLAGEVRLILRDNSWSFLLTDGALIAVCRCR